LTELSILAKITVLVARDGCPSNVFLARLETLVSMQLESTLGSKYHA
jgi:hypothetical protein